MRKHTQDGGLKESNNRHNYSYNVNQLNNHDRRMVYREGRKNFRVFSVCPSVSAVCRFID